MLCCFPQIAVIFAVKFSNPKIVDVVLQVRGPFFYSIGHFTVVCLVTWSWIGTEAGGYFVHM